VFLNRLIKKLGKLQKRKSDNITEFISKLAIEWSEINQIVFKDIKARQTKSKCIDKSI